jgi:hypothetical protein
VIFNTCADAAVVESSWLPSSGDWFTAANWNPFGVHTELRRYDLPGDFSDPPILRLPSEVR